MRTGATARRKGDDEGKVGAVGVWSCLIVAQWQPCSAAQQRPKLLRQWDFRDSRGIKKNGMGETTSKL